MQATGLRTGQPAFNRGLVGALLAVVVTAGLVALLIVGTIARNPAVPSVATIAGFDAATRSDMEFQAMEPTAYAALHAAAQQQAFNQFRADERAVLTSAQSAAIQREAVRKFHLAVQAEKSSAALSQGLADYYTSARDSNAAWTNRAAGHGSYAK